jgi:hypothetical protein
MVHRVSRLPASRPAGPRHRPAHGRDACPDANEPAARFQPLGTIAGRFVAHAHDIGRVQQLLSTTMPMLVASLGGTWPALVTDEFVQIEIEGRVDQTAILAPALDAAIAVASALAQARAQI